VVPRPSRNRTRGRPARVLVIGHQADEINALLRAPPSRTPHANSRKSSSKTRLTGRAGSIRTVAMGAWSLAL